MISFSISVLFQIAQVFGLYYETQLKFPRTTSSSMQFAGDVVKLRTFGFGCGTVDSRMQAITQTAMANLLPVIPFGTLALCYVLGRALPPSKWRPCPDQSFAQCLGLFSTFFISIANFAINTGFAEYKHPCGEKSLYHFPFIRSTDDDATTIKVLSLVGVFVWCLGGLATVSYILWKLPSRANDVHFRRKSLPIVIRFRPEMPWWYLVMLFRFLAKFLDRVLLFALAPNFPPSLFE
jgi:hypothetical protein